MRLSTYRTPSVMLLPVFLFVLNVSARAEDNPNVSMAALRAQTAVEDSGAQTFSPGVSAVLKLLEAKVNTDVIKTYIKNSSAAYDLSAEQVVALKERGVPDDLVTAMMQRGSELRGQTAQNTGQNPLASGPAYTGVPAMTVEPYAYYDYPAYWGGYPYDYSYWWNYSTWPGFVDFGFYNFGRPFRHGDFLHGRSFGPVNRAFPPTGFVRSPLGSPPMLHGFSGMGSIGSRGQNFSGTLGPTGSFGGLSGPSAFGFRRGTGGHPGGRR